MSPPSHTALPEASSDSPVTSRRRFTALCLASLTATAGCLGSDGDDADDGPGNNGLENDTGPASGSEIAPDGIDGILFVENRMLEDESAVGVTEGITAAGTELVEGDVVSEYSTLAVELGQSDVAHERSTLFYRADEHEYGALVVETDDDQEAALEYIQNRFDDSEETSYGDSDGIVGERNGQTEWLVPLGEESLIVGTESAVTDSLDVYHGDSESFGGELHSAYTRASDGELKATMTVESDELAVIVGEINPDFAAALGWLSDPDILTVTYQTLDDDTVAFDLQLTMESADDAEGFQGTIELFIEDENGLPIGGDAIDDDLLESLSVDRTDEHVTLTLSTTPEELASYFD